MFDFLHGVKADESTARPTDHESLHIHANEAHGPREDVGNAYFTNNTNSSWQHRLVGDARQSFICSSCSMHCGYPKEKDVEDGERRQTRDVQVQHTKKLMLEALSSMENWVH
eukprot:2435592-Prymnesium_polylepis.2